jgi:hypothetical protein
MQMEPDNETLRKIRQLSDNVRRRRRFQGYAGWPRMLSGAVTLVAAFVMTSTTWVPTTAPAHLASWTIVLAIALAVNYGHLAWWFFSHKEIRTRPAELKPALDALPPLAAGAVLSIALILHGHYNLLFGTWMLMYGLAQTTYAGKLPVGVYATGLVYMACGTLLLIMTPPFTNPWPMALMFVCGELAGGLCLMEKEEN